MAVEDNVNEIKAQVGPTRGFPLAKDFQEEMKKTPRIEDMQFISQLDDYRKSPMFSGLFNDSNFRNAILGAKYLEYNKNRLDYLKQGSNEGQVSEEALYNLADQGILKDPLLSTNDQDALLTRDNLKQNVIDRMPFIQKEIYGTGSNSLPSTESEDFEINKRLKYILNNPIKLAGEDNYAFTVLDGKGGKYQIPTFQETTELLREDDTRDGGVDITPAAAYQGGMDMSMRSPKEEMARNFKLLQNLGLDEIKIAEFMYAERNGMMDQFRTKYGVGDFLTLAPYILRGIGESVNDSLNEMTNVFKDDLKTTPLGKFVAPKIDTSENTFGTTKFGANVLSEKTDGVLTVDGATALLAYNPTFKDTIQKEALIGAATYIMTGGVGLTMGAIKNGAFRNYVKKTFGGDTFENALKNANKKGLTDADIFEQYWQEGNYGFLNNFRKNMTLFTMKMDQEARGIVDPKQRARVGYLKTKLDNANEKYKYLTGEFKNKRITQTALDTQANVIRKLERNIETENLKALVPESFRSLAKDEFGVTLGIASINHYYQMNSVDPENMQPNFFLSLLGGIGGVYTTELGLRGTNNLINGIKDHFNYNFRGGDLPKFKGKAKEVYKWLSLADPRIQEDVISSIDSHKAISDKLTSITVNGKPVIANSKSFDQTVYKLVALNVLRSQGDQVIDSIKHSDLRDFSGPFQTMLLNQKDKVRLYNEMSTAITDLRKARLHPEIEADQAMKDTINNYIAMYDDYGKHLKMHETQVNKFATKIEDNLTAMIDGLKASPAEFNPTVVKNYQKKLEVLSNYHIENALMDGFEPDEAVKIANQKLDKFTKQIETNLNDVDSITSNVPITNDALWQSSSKIRNDIKLNADAKFKHLKLTYGKQGGNPVFMDGTDFYGLIKNFNGPDFEEYFESGEMFATEITRGAKKVADIKPGVLPNKFALLFEDSAAKFINAVETSNSYNPVVKEALQIAKEANPDAGSFEIWKEMYDELGGELVQLPIGFDDWKQVAQTMNTKAFNRKGTVQGLQDKSIYDFWVDLAEDKADGFATNFFSDTDRTFMAGQVINDWKAAKGEWHDYLSRYKSGFSKSWYNVVGTEPKSGAVILANSPEKWVSELVGKLSTKNLTQEGADQLVSELAQALGGTNISQQGGLAKWSFDASQDNLPLKTVRKLLHRVGKQTLLNSPAGKILRDALLNKNIVKPGDLTELKAGESFQVLLNNIDLLKTSTGQKLINKAEVEEGFDVLQLYAYSKDFNVQAKQVQKEISTEIKNITTELKNRQTDIMGKIKKQRDTIFEKFTPAYIHNQIQLGKQGLMILDETRDTYQRLVLDQLGATKLSDLNSMQAKNFDGIMKEYDRAIAGRALEHVDNMTKIANPDTTPKVETSPLDGTLDINSDDLVKGETMLQVLGTGKSWEQTFRELVKRGSVDGSDEVFNNYQTIGAFMTGERASKIPFKVQGVPRSLSMASWVSRAYAWQRGVVGTQYLGTEAAVHAIRKGKYGLFEEMMNNPEIGRIVVKMLESGDPPSFKDNIALKSAFIRIIARNQAEADSDTDPRTKDLNKFSKELKLKKKKDIEDQMERLSKKTTERKIGDDLVEGAGNAVSATGNFVKENVINPVSNFIQGENNENVQ